MCFEVLGLLGAGLAKGKCRAGVMCSILVGSFRDSACAELESGRAKAVVPFLVQAQEKQLFDGNSGETPA